MPESAFRRVGEVVYYQQTSTYTGEILPGIWEVAALIDRLGAERLVILERAGVVTVVER